MLDLTTGETVLLMIAVFAITVAIDVAGRIKRVGGVRGAVTLYRKGRREALDRRLREQLGEEAPLPGWVGGDGACWHAKAASIVARDRATHPETVKWNEECHVCGATRGTWAVTTDL